GGERPRAEHLGRAQVSTWSVNAAPDHFQREANGTSASVSSGEPPGAAAIASDVEERTLPAAATRASAWRAAASGTPDAATTSTSSSVPSVSVPVLSRQT